MVTRKAEAATIQKDWDINPRWQGIKRGYTAEDGALAWLSAT